MSYLTRHDLTLRTNRLGLISPDEPLRARMLFKYFSNYTEPSTRAVPQIHTEHTLHINLQFNLSNALLSFYELSSGFFPSTAFTVVLVCCVQAKKITRKVIITFIQSWFDFC